MYCTNCGKPNEDTSRFCMYCGTTLEAPVSYAAETQRKPANGRDSRRLRWALLAAVAVLGVLALLAGAALLAGRLWLRLDANETAKLMPADTVAFLHISPDIRQLPRISDISRLQVLAAPVQILGLADSNDMEAGLSDTGIDIERDVLPWIGLEGGIGIVDRGDEAGVIAALATRNRKASDRFLENVQRTMQDSGSAFDQEVYRDVPITFEVRGADEGTSFATVNRLVVVASDLATMHETIDTWKDGVSNLAESDGYRELARRLPDNSIGSVFLQSDLLQQVLGMNINVLQDAGVGDSIGIAVSLQKQGAQVDIVQATNMSSMSRSQTDWTRRSTFDSSITKAIPREALFVSTGENLAEGWRVALASIPDVSPNDIQDLADTFREATGVDLERDLLSWMTGGYALALVGDPNDSLDLGLPATPVLIVEVAGREQDDADAAVGDLLQTLADDADMTIRTSRFGNSEMQAATSPYSDVTLGYGFVGDYLVIGLSQDALAALAEAPNDPLAEQPNFRASQKPLPDKNHGILYLDVQELVRLLKRTMGTRDREDFALNVEPYINPIKAVSATSMPADKDGFQRSTIFLYLSE